MLDRQLASKLCHFVFRKLIPSQSTGMCANVITPAILPLSVYGRAMESRRRSQCPYLECTAEVLHRNELLKAFAWGYRFQMCSATDPFGVVHVYLSDSLLPYNRFLKVAILMQYLRLLDPKRTDDPFMYVTARGMIAVILLYHTISTCITAFACNPRERIWNPLVTEYKCLDNTIGILFTCLFNIISDLIILALPTRAVWRLRIPRRKKVSIVLLFATGLL